MQSHPADRRHALVKGPAEKAKGTCAVAAPISRMRSIGRAPRALVACGVTASVLTILALADVRREVRRQAGQKK